MRPWPPRWSLFVGQIDSVPFLPGLFRLSSLTRLGPLNRLQVTLSLRFTANCPVRAQLSGTRVATAIEAGRTCLLRQETVGRGGITDTADYGRRPRSAGNVAGCFPQARFSDAAGRRRPGGVARRADGRSPPGADRSPHAPADGDGGDRADSATAVAAAVYPDVRAVGRGIAAAGTGFRGAFQAGQFRGGHPDGGRGVEIDLRLATGAWDQRH